MVPNRVARDISVGAIVSLGIILFAIAVMAISKESRLFVPKVMYWTSLGNTSGLTVGSPVRLVGMQIGTVSSIIFPEELRERRLRVEFTIDRTFADRIRTGTQASLRALNYLAQDKYIELSPGDPDRPTIPPEGYIEPGVSLIEETLQRGQSIADDVKEITASLRDLLVAINQGDGLIQQMIHNPDLGRKGAESLEGSLTSLRSVLEGVEEGKGFAGVLLTDQVFARKQIENIDAALGHLRAIMERLDSDESFVGQLASPDGDAAQTIADLRASAAALRKFTDDLESAEGLLGRLTRDEEFADGFLRKLDSAAGHVDSILGKVDGGEGTLGGLVNDPEVYQGMKDVMKGVRKSRVGKGLIRHYQKKGAKERAREEEAQEGEESRDSAQP